jgi:putative FmdB family regulatory protein
MPTYDYVCTTCGKNFEYMQAMKEEPLTTCPVEICDQPEKGKGHVERRITGGSGIIYKGGGFYHTDYVKKSGSGSGEGE